MDDFGEVLNTVFNDIYNDFDIPSTSTYMQMLNFHDPPLTNQPSDTCEVVKDSVSNSKEKLFDVESPYYESEHESCFNVYSSECNDIDVPNFLENEFETYNSYEEDGCLSRSGCENNKDFYEQNPTPKKERKRKKIRRYSSNIPDQKRCCVKGCENACSNRLNKSLRQPIELDKNQIKFGNIKICNKCYFSNLYRWKKTKDVKKIHVLDKLILD